MTLESAGLLAAVLRDDTSTKLLIGMLLFAAAGFLMAFGALLLGRILRPTADNREKSAIYECGEPAIGRGWVQFDLRFYVVALVFIVFDVEIALFWPWAVIFGGGGRETAPAAELHQVRSVALYDMLFFFGVVVVGFAYLWRYGYLDWVRATRGEPAPES
jgi:NADH-quinone oxidoreductase subunit A